MRQNSVFIQAEGLKVVTELTDQGTCQLRGGEEQSFIHCKNKSMYFVPKVCSL